MEEHDTGRIVVHNYGAGSTGYQAGFVMAMEAVGLALPHLVKNVSGCKHVPVARL
jgi:D-amino-acid oxidase